MYYILLLVRVDSVVGEIAPYPFIGELEKTKLKRVLVNIMC